MKIKIFFLPLICIACLVACSEQLVTKNKVIATLKGAEIKVSDILTQYPLEDEYIDIYLKEEIVIHEAKSLGITVSEEKIEEVTQNFYPDFENETDQVKDFYRQQAEKLKMSAEEYYEIWSRTHVERNEYIQEYIKLKFDEPSSYEKAENWGDEIEVHINNLFTVHKDNHDLIMK